VRQLRGTSVGRHGVGRGSRGRDGGISPRRAHAVRARRGGMLGRDRGIGDSRGHGRDDDAATGSRRGVGRLGERRRAVRYSTCRRMAGLQGQQSGSGTRRRCAIQLQQTQRRAIRGEGGRLNACAGVWGYEGVKMARTDSAVFPQGGRGRRSGMHLPGSRTSARPGRATWAVSAVSGRAESARRPLAQTPRPTTVSHPPRPRPVSRNSSAKAAVTASHSLPSCAAAADQHLRRPLLVQPKVSLDAGASQYSGANHRPSARGPLSRGPAFQLGMIALEAGAIGA
jgi:hypothetical protein